MFLFKTGISTMRINLREMAMEWEGPDGAHLNAIEKVRVMLFSNQRVLAPLELRLHHHPYDLTRSSFLGSPCHIEHPGASLFGRRRFVLKRNRDLEVVAESFGVAIATR